MPPIGELVCFEMKMIGKPYAGELQVRFDEGEQDCVPRAILNGHKVGNDGYGQGSPYRMLRLFSTLPKSMKDGRKQISRARHRNSLAGEMRQAS
jgi:hypothetical protein